MIETPKVGCDAFIINDKNEVLLIQRSDNKLWALPGGYNDLGETPMECAIRECFEETGLKILITSLLGVFSSLKYPHTGKSINRGREICHLLFSGQVESGELSTSAESQDVQWFLFENLPPLSDGHTTRVEFGFRCINGIEKKPFYE